MLSVSGRSEFALLDLSKLMGASERSLLRIAIMQLQRLGLLYEHPPSFVSIHQVWSKASIEAAGVESIARHSCPSACLLIGRMRN